MQFDLGHQGGELSGSAVGEPVDRFNQAQQLSHRWVKMDPEA